MAKHKKSERGTAGGATPATADRLRPEATPRQEEERLAHALISRGLVTREEVQGCKAAAAGAEPGAEALLKRLEAAGFLTAGQARRAVQALEALLGQQIPGYELLERLGQGSMGTVFKARQLSMNRLVAVKIMHPRLAADPLFLKRLTREAHLAARLSHNNVVQAIDVGSAGSLHYFVMELVEGRTIREDLDAGKVFPEREAVGIVLQVARALQHAHGRGLVHRDVKPANIVLTPEGIAKLADLGMAREAEDSAQARQEHGLTIGTPFYIAPEQVRGRMDIDGRADLYALGATYYHMVTGRVPFPGRDVEAVCRAHVEERLTPPGEVNEELSTGLGEVIELLMTKDRRKRYQSADDLILDLECLVADEPPRLARERLGTSTLQGLAEGEPEPDYEIIEEDEDEVGEDEEGDDGWGPPENAWMWIAILGGLLGISFLVNMILIAIRHRS